MPESCATCRFAQQGPNHKPGHMVACRRNPPTVMYCATQQLGLDNKPHMGWQTATSFPMTPESNWCGEYSVVPGASILTQ